MSSHDQSQKHTSQGHAQACPRCRSIPAYFAVLGFLIIALHWGMQTGFRRMPTGLYGVSNLILNGQLDADILISGSSRAVGHFDPVAITTETGLRCFNIGRNGSQTDMQLAVLKAALRYNRKPKLIVHSLDSFTFVMTKEIYDPAQYMPYLEDADIYSAVRKIHPQAWKWKHIPLYGYLVEDMRFTWITGLLARLGFYPSEDRILGFKADSRQWTGEFERFQKAHPDGVDFEVEPHGVQVLEELADLAAQMDIPLLFVYSPVYEPMQRLEKNREAIFGEFRRIAAKHRNLIWDFSGDELCKDRSLFYNSQHLNGTGAAKFSRLLADRLRKERPWESAKSSTPSP